MDEGTEKISVEGNRIIHKIEVDRSPELEALRQELENVKSERDELKGSLEVIADKEFQAKKRTLASHGFDISGIGDGSTQSDIDKLTELEKSDSLRPPTGGNTAPLNDFQLGKSHVNTDEGYDSIPEMVADLNRKARDDSNPAESAEADAILKELNKDSVKAVRNQGRPNLSYDIDPAELSKLRRETKREIAEKIIKRGSK